MTNPTTPFSWQMPTATNLVTDLPADFETFGQAVATSMADLLGGTTGQVLSKASNTNMDFTWVTTDDANAIQNSIVDAKGDIVAASANDTPARLAVGSNGETLVADSSTSTGLRYQGNFSAGKNKIINGDMSIWQRGTTFNSLTNGTYTADRWQAGKDGTATINVSQQTFTPGTAPVAGYEGQYFLRFDVSAWTSSPVFLTHKIEDVRTFAGQTVTVSFWAKANSSTTNDVLYLQDFGSGGSGAVVSSTSITIGTSWARYSVTFAIPSITGKTVGTSSSLYIQILRFSAAKTVDVWGVQVEAGSVATAFQTATGTIQGELAACQRYYYRATSTAAFQMISGFGTGKGTTQGIIDFKVPATMRVTPTTIDFANVGLYDYTNAVIAATSVTIETYASPNDPYITVTCASGVTALRPYAIISNNTVGGYVGIGAEL